MYFISYYEYGVKSNTSIYQSSEWFRIANATITIHPILWLKEKEQMFKKKRFENPGDVSYLREFALIWWKELTDEEIEVLNL